MEFVLNETTLTVHKQERGTTGLETVCGANYHLDPGQLQTLTADSLGDLNASKCGRCFGGGY